MNVNIARHVDNSNYRWCRRGRGMLSLWPRWPNPNTPRCAWHRSARITYTRGPYTTPSTRWVSYRLSSTRALRRTSASTMETGRFWHCTAWLPTPPPQFLATNIDPGIWFHELPALATVQGVIVAVDARTTLAGGGMTRVAQCGHGAFQAHVACGVGSSQVGEAMILLSSCPPVQRRAEQPGVS